MAQKNTILYPIPLLMTNSKRFVIVFILSALTLSAYSQTPSQQTDKKDNKINWMSFDQAMKQYSIEKKPIMVDMYTSWCGFCKKLDAETFKDPRIIKYINEHYYAVKFDAETTEPITYKDSVYTNLRIGTVDADGNPVRGKSHSLAEILLNGRMAYPTLVYMIPDKDIVAPVPGYVTPEKIEPYLLFFADKVYEGNLFDAFTKGMNTEPIIKH